MADTFEVVAEIGQADTSRVVVVLDRADTFVAVAVVAQADTLGVVVGPGQVGTFAVAVVVVVDRVDTFVAVVVVGQVGTFVVVAGNSVVVLDFGKLLVAASDCYLQIDLMVVWPDSDLMRRYYLNSNLLGCHYFLDFQLVA